MSIIDVQLQAERLRKEEADAHRKAEDEAKKKIALSNMGSGYSGILQRVILHLLLHLLLHPPTCPSSQTAGMSFFSLTF